MKESSIPLLLCCLLILASCASMQSFKVPGADLAKVHSIYVNTVPNDQDVGKSIIDQLNKMGYKTTHGTSAVPPSPVDAIVTYEDRWKWDITMYLLKLTVKVRDGTTNQLLATSESYQPSLQRESVEDVAEKVLLSIFSTQPQK